jgi:hypothetical protein
MTETGKIISGKIIPKIGHGFCQCVKKGTAKT